MEIKMDYEGKTYKRYNGNWIDSSYMIAPLIVQEALDKRYAQSLSLEHYSVEELIKLADEFKNNESYILAAKHYREAISRADRDTCRYIYPRLTSCLRKIGRSREAVEIISLIKKKYGMELITPVLLTSVAAAYCDLNEFGNAKRCADLAYCKLNRNPSEELRLVYARIRKHTEK